MFSYLFILFFGFFLPSVSFACASCGCSLSSNWQEASSEKFKIDLRYDYINQNQLRAGSSTISPGAASQIVNNGNPQEVELYTVNNYITTTIEYNPDPSWKVNLVLPYISRGHSTLGTASNGYTGGAGGGQYTSNTSSLGDVKLMGRYQGFSEQHNWGVTLGFKFPTGSTTQTGTSTDLTPGNGGPVPIDRGLQPGTGTTDLIVGLFYSQAISKNWDYFTEALFQSAMTTNNQYRPGDGANLNVGFRYVGFEFFVPVLQLNYRTVQTDSGANADMVSTGGNLVYLSPGVVALLGAGFEAYTFIQTPVYQYLYGVQLAPTMTESLGVRYSF